MISTGRLDVHVLARAMDAAGGENQRLLRALEEAEHEIAQLRAGLESGTVIGQAQGLLMAWLDIDADQSHGYLRRVARHEHRKPLDVAAEIIATRHLPHAAGEGPVGTVAWGDDEGGVAPPMDPTDRDD